MAPSYSSTIDYDSNRRLEHDGTGSEAGVLAIDLRLKRALENLDFTIEPRYAFRRFSDSSLGNGDDRSIFSAFNFNRETSTLNVTASYWDQSTLVTEQLETGIVAGDTHRRMAQASAAWTWSQTERRALVTQVSDMDVSYYGEEASRLPGYKYPAGSIGERFIFSDRGSFTVSSYGSLLQSDTAGNSSHSLGIEGEVVYAFSELTNLDATVGQSERNLSGSNSRGTDASVALNHAMLLNRVTLSYTRSLVPYGNGFLAERQQYGASLTHSWTETVDGTLSALRVQNNETTVLLRLDRRSYDSVSASLNWRPTPTWSLATQLSGIWTQTPDLVAQSVRGWHGAITLSWTPLPSTRSW
jgi:hypothetical protein